MPVDLSKIHTFGVAVSALDLVEIHSFSDLSQAFNEGVFIKKHLILGGGSNVLFTNDFDGTIVLNKLKGKSILPHPTDSHKKLCSIQSGELWHDFVLFALSNNLGGVENLSLIPGTVGAAPIQNIGAYGVELKDVFYNLKAFDKTSGNMITMYESDCHFGYRESIFKHTYKNRFFITEVTLTLTADNHPLHTNYGAIKHELDKMQQTPSIHSISEAVIKIRKSKLPDPKLLGNAGSFFKNVEVSTKVAQALKNKFPDIPLFVSGDKIKIPTGWLIEYCGWKGKSLGNAGCHKEQALVLVNLGGATTHELITLAKTIQSDVYAMFGIHITPEVNIIE